MAIVGATPVANQRSGKLPCPTNPDRSYHRPRQSGSQETKSRNFPTIARANARWIGPRLATILLPMGKTTIHAGHRLRRCRTSLPDHVYLITFVTRERKPLFHDPNRAMAFCRACVDRRSWNDARLLAWVLMPDHWHGLIQLGEHETLSRVVQRVKAGTAKAIDVPAPVWQAGFHDRAIRGEQSMLSAARYLVANPLRAGLVDSVGLWPWWDAVWV